MISDTKLRTRTRSDHGKIVVRRDESFSERYGGTEYATPTPVVAAAASDSRGRTFVLVSIAATVSTSALIIGSSIG